MTTPELTIKLIWTIIFILIVVDELSPIRRGLILVYDRCLIMTGALFLTVAQLSHIRLLGIHFIRDLHSVRVLEIQVIVLVGLGCKLANKFLFFFCQVTMEYFGEVI